MKSKILALFLGFAIGLTLIADAQRTGGFPSRPLFQSVTIGAGTRADTRQELRINATDQLGIRITGPRPVLKLNESTQAADNRLWYVEADGVNFRVRAVDDAEAVATDPISIARSGATATDITLTGRTIHDSLTAAQVAQFNNANANGPYISFSRSGNPVGDIGDGPQIGGGGALGDFAIGTRATGDFVVATGATIAERFRIQDNGTSIFTGPAAAHVATFAGSGTSSYIAFTRSGTFLGYVGSGDSLGGGGDSGDLAIATHNVAGADMVFATGATRTERMRIAEGGTITFGAAGALGNISQGTFTASFDTACTTTPTITYDYTRVGQMVTLYPVSQTGFTCTSDSTQFATSLADVPAAIRPNTAVAGPIGDAFTNNGANVWAEVNLTSAGNIAFHLCGTFGTATCNVTGWTASGNKGAELFRPITYMLGNP